MVIELECISQYPIPENKVSSIRSYVPQRVFQKKLFIVENLQIEEHVNSKGSIVKKFTTAKYDNEFYKINTPYEKLKKDYFTPLIIKGYSNA